MAKKDNKKTETKNQVATTMTADNVMEVINNANVVEATITDKVLEQVQKEEDERKQYEVKRRYLRAKYQQIDSLLQIRRDRAISKVTQFKLVGTDRLVRFLMGYELTEEVINHAKNIPDFFEKETVNEKDKTITITIDDKKTTFKVGDKVPSVIDIVDYDEMHSKLVDEIRKKMSECDDNYCKERKKAEAAFGDYFLSSWRW